MNEQGKPGEPKKVDTQPLPLKGEGKLVLGRKNEFGPVRACVRFWEPGREQHQRNRLPALLEPCEPVVNE